MINNSSRTRIATTLSALAAALLLAAGCSDGAASPAMRSVPTPAVSESGATPTPATAVTVPASSSRYPSSMVALGHSGNTGYNSDPDSPGNDARQNSWATGDNPAVNSIYSRLLKLNPALRDHAMNLSVNGTNVDDLVTQAGQAVSLEPLPELYLISSVDNDIRCDGTDGENYDVFGDTLRSALKIIATAAPQAQIFIVSSPLASEENYAAMLAKVGAKDHATGSGPCDLYDSAGKLQPKHLRYTKAVTARYHEQVVQVCGEFTQCRYDGGALRRMVIVPADVTSDHDHLSIKGHHKEAAVEWAVLSKTF